MYNDFLNFITEKELFTPKDRILLGVSGGSDSMAMLHLFGQSAFKFGVAHCNFKLRGEDSDNDQKFVKKLAKKIGIPFFTTEFDTQHYAKIKGLSIEMAARELRYNWFEQIRMQHQFDYIAVAHHLDDSIETFHLNLLRGTGISGLTGIKAKNNRIVRPMLFAKHRDIINLIQENNIKFREDKSNRDTRILRNRFRHLLIPNLEQLNPAYKNAVLQTMQNLAQARQILDTQIEKAKQEILSKHENGERHIEIQKLLQLENRSFYLYEILKKYNFNAGQCNDILKQITSVGAVYHSTTHDLLTDRNRLIIREIINKNNEQIYTIELNDSDLELPINLRFKVIDQSASFTIDKNKNTAQLDFFSLQFPLKLRKWRNGDKFRPLGMNGYKKVSDFLIDRKLNRFEKEQVWVLQQADNEIVWVVNQQISEPFKVRKSSIKVLEIRLE